MNNKDRINKISGIAVLVMLAVVISGYITGSVSLLGISNDTLLYVVMPTGLIWFATRKNGCGSCNQIS
ncbi:hypothetical protein [Nitrosopumilus ureiphilus]|uniref:Uncharacterized protein n=1 Tax=Nitrosopumilus ureiphilus TaxID=1470067 RepID=A0A7D5MB52_9ARCH|nr:hypothetical protein [Nitrosopumilus ureiphilus]QLH07449.1 hypothetical protein C5F50_10500 [Nitrosopumilus ureiphilus]